MKRIALTLVILALFGGFASAGGAKDTANKPITAVWYPNNSGEDWKAARQAFDELITKATGRPVVDKLTTDYVIAIEALATGNAAIAYPGAVGFIQAQLKNPKVQPLVVNSGDSGTLNDAFYYSRIVVRTEDAPQYLKDGKYTLDKIKGKVMSFVSTSSTSGFLFPSNVIKSYFNKAEKFGDKKVEDLFLEGGADKFFSQVVFGQSHQGSVFNVLSKKADVGAVDDVDVDSYFDLVSGKANEVGAVYKVKEGAAAPFDTIPGASFTVLSSITVKNAPITVNTDLFTTKELKDLQAAFLADATTNNPKLFVPADVKGVTGFWKQKGKNRFLAADNAWYDSIRDLLK